MRARRTIKTKKIIYRIERMPCPLCKAEVMAGERHECHIGKNGTCSFYFERIEIVPAPAPPKEATHD